MRRFTRKLWRPLRRRLPAGFTLVAYLVAVFGVPVPAESRSSSNTKACGCATDDCHDGKCCCAPKPAPPKPTSCCEGKPGCTMPCCQHGSSSGGGKHAPPTESPKRPTEPEQPADDDNATDGVSVVLGIAAMKCRGHSTLWVSTGASLPAPATAAWKPSLIFEGWLPATSDHAISLRIVPPDPPPRSTAL